MNDKRWLFVLVLIVFILSISISQAELIPVNKYPDVTTGQNTEWFYVKVDSIDKDKYIGINKLSRGEFGFADDGQYYGKMWMIPAYEVAGSWYLCPIRNIETVNSFTDLGNGWEFDVSDSALTCYEYNNYVNSVDVPMDIVFSFETNNQGQTKINVTTTISGYSPTDTGFGFLFFPEDNEKYRYVQTDTTDIDLLGTEQEYAVDKDFAFLDSGRIRIGDWFDWSDMLDTGTLFSETLTIGTKKGFLVGSYGYGASTTITIDPLYTVDYSPTPATHLIDGILDSSSESEFGQEIDITTGVSDNLTSTEYETGILKNEIITLYTEDWEDQSVARWSMVAIYDDVEDQIQIVDENNDSDSITNISLRFLGSASHNGDDDAYITRLFDTTNLTDIEISYDRSCHDRESGDYFYVQISTDNISYTTIETLQDDVVLDTNEYDTPSQYWNGSLYLRFRSESDYINDRCYVDNIIIKGKNKSRQDKSISGRFAETYDSEYYYGINIYLNDSSTTNLTVFSYDNSNDLSSVYTNKILYGSGWFDINVTGLMDYMTNNASMSFTQFRIYSENSSYISEVRLRKEINDTQAPSIENCSVNSNQITCLEDIIFSCDIIDDVIVSSVFFQIDGNNVTPMKNNNQYVYTISPQQNTSLTTYTLENVFAYDEVNNMNMTTENIDSDYSCVFEDYINISHVSQQNQGILNLTNTTVTIFWSTSNPSDSLVEYGLSPSSLNNTGYSSDNVLQHYIDLEELSPNTTYYYSVTSSYNPNQTLSGFNFTTLGAECVPDWQVQYGACLTNDSQLKYYTDANDCGTNESLPVDNGTYIYCNYCSEDLVIESQTECYLNGSFGQKQVNYTDDNYLSCCAVTGLVSDCSIDYAPYNDTIITSCEFTSQDFSLIMDDNLYFGYGEDKVFGIARINSSSNTSYQCLSYVSTLEKKPIQSNPDYEKVTDSIFSLSGKKYEDREFFQAHNNLVNVYWTNENLVIDGRQYIFSVECSDNKGNQLISEHVATVNYEPVNSPITRWFWANENMSGLIMGLVIFAILIFILGFAITSLRRNR